MKPTPRQIELLVDACGCRKNLVETGSVSPAEQDVQNITYRMSDEERLKWRRSNGLRAAPPSEAQRQMVREYEELIALLLTRSD